MVKGETDDGKIAYIKHYLMILALINQRLKPG